LSQLRPDLLPIERAQFASGDPTTSRRLNASTVLRRDCPTGFPIGHGALDYANGSSQTPDTASFKDCKIKWTHDHILITFVITKTTPL
jgi:hypothetical protein